jgi:urea transport system permease protein
MPTLRLNSRSFLLNVPVALRWLPLTIAVLCAFYPARAGASVVDDSLAAIGSGDLQKTERAIAAMAGSGEDRALDVLMAFAAGKLAFDGAGTALIETDSGAVSAATGEPVQPSGTLTGAAVNNVVRRALRPALAQLRLRAKNAGIRLEAAQEVSQRPSEDLLEPMKQALAAETDSTIAKQLRLGIAQVDLESADRDRRLAALATLESDGDVSHKGLLEPLVKEATEPDENIRAEARGALSAIERRITLISLLANLFYGLSLGSVLLLAALGLAITFGLMKVINMAHGEMLMLGAYSTFVVQNIFVASLPSLADYYLIAAIPVAFGVSGLVGLILERGIVRHLYGRPLETLLATWGISLLLIQTVRLTFGAQNVAVANPTWLSGGWELMPTVVLPYSRLVIIAFTVVVVTFVWFLLRRTRLGLYVRAVTQNREMAGSLGIPTDKIDMWTFTLGSGVAGLGGVALSQLGNVGPELGQGFIVDSFMVVVLGGVGNIFGTIAGAMGLGLVNKLLEPIAGAVLGKIVVLVLIILFIQKRPQGMFALKGRAAEL